MTESEAIRVLKEAADSTQEEYDMAFNLAIETLKKQSNGVWIPCSERLPSENGEYLICDDKGKIYESTYFFGSWLIRTSTLEVIAWQPLPTPYKSEV